MAVRFLIGDVRTRLRELPANSVDAVVTSPPFWGQRSYLEPGHPDKHLEIGQERTLGEHIATLVDIAAEIRRVLKPGGVFWMEYGDVFASKPNGTAAVEARSKNGDDRTFRDKPFDTTGPIYDPAHGTPRGVFQGTNMNGRGDGSGARKIDHGGKVIAGGVFKPKDLCLVPTRIAIALHEAGWWVRRRPIWGKPNAMPDSRGQQRPGTSHSEIYMFAKSADHYYNADAVVQPVSGGTHERVARGGQGSKRAYGGALSDRPMKAVLRGVDRGKRKDLGYSAAALPAERLLRDFEPAPVEVWTIPAKGYRGAHFATFPVELAARCILAGCPPGGVVLDPFGGVGTTALAAERLGRDSILIELNAESVVEAKERLAADAAGERKRAESGRRA